MVCAQRTRDVNLCRAMGVWLHLISMLFHIMPLFKSNGTGLMAFAPSYPALLEESSAMLEHPSTRQSESQL